MVAGYTRQAAANIQPGLRANAEDLNAEYNQLAAAFDNAGGHDHSGSVAGDGVKIPLGSAVTGVLPIANGGSGSSTNTPATLQVNPGGLLVGTAGAVPGTGALTLNANTVAGPAGTAGNLSVMGADTAAAAITLNSFGSTGGPTVSGHATRGTAASPTATQLGDGLLTLQGQGWVTAYTAAQARITMSAAENWTGTAQGTLIDFVTAPAGGTAQVLSLRLAGNTATFSDNVFMGPTVSGADIVTQMNGNGTAGGHVWTIATKGAAPIGEFWIYDNTASALRLEITTAGACAASSAWGVISDVSLKSEIEDHPHGLAEILQLQPKRFRLVDDDRIATGLIAQELEAVMPELVGEMPTLDGGTVKTVTETGIIWPLVNAIKELKAEIEELRAKLGA